MIDIFWTQASVETCLYCFILFMCFWLFFQKRVLDIDSNKSIGITLFSILLLLTFCPEGDFYHYQSNVWHFKYNSVDNYWEPFYNYLVPLCRYNYLLFRIVVWGGAYWFSRIAFKRYGVNENFASFLLVTSFLVTFNYARASLAFASFFLGYSFISVPTEKKWIGYSFAIVMFYLAYQFHHSSFVLILVFLVMLFVPVNKKSMILCFLLIPVLSSIISDYLYTDFFGNEYLDGKIEHYSQVEGGDAMTWKGYIRTFISYGAFIFPLAVNTIAIIKYKDKVMWYIRKLNNSIIAIVALACSFLFIGVESMVFFYRIFYMPLIGLVIVTTYLYQEELISRRIVNMILIFGALNTLYTLLVTFILVW